MVIDLKKKNRPHHESRMLARRHQIIESTSKLAVGGRPIRAHRLSLPGAAANRHQKVTCPPVLCGGYLLSLFRTTSLLRLREILTLIDLGHGRQPGRSSAPMHHGRAMQNDTRSTFGTLFPAAPSRPAARRMIGPPPAPRGGPAHAVAQGVCSLLVRPRVTGQ
jgi:hypothetical protein